MSQARRHAAPRPSSRRRKAPKERWARRFLTRRTPSEPAPAVTKAELGHRRARRAGWVPPEDLAEAAVLVTGESVQLPGVFRLDGGRRSWLAGLDEVPRPPARLVEAPLAPALVFAFPPEAELPTPDASDDTAPGGAAEPSSHSIPQQAGAGSARHARAR